MSQNERPTPYYQDELVTLYNGDCRDIRAWLLADVLITDPPYGRGWKQGTIGDHAKNDASRGITNDRDTSVRDDALALWGSGPAIVFGDLMLAPPVGTKHVCIYHKTDGAAGLRGAIAGVRRDAEAIYLIGAWPSGLGGRSAVFAARGQITGSQGAVARSGGHPHTKPGDVMEALLTLTEGVVADPFAGSGSTLVAAKRLGRRAVGIEIEERYAELAASRLAQDVLDFGEAS